MRKTASMRRSMKWIRNIAAFAMVFGLFAATPVTAFAKGDKSTQQNNGNQNGEGNGGNDSGNGNGGNNAGDHNPQPVPEVPYAAILPIVIVGMTVFVYRRRKKSA